jgi:hypothetical protein
VHPPGANVHRAGDRPSPRNSLNLRFPGTACRVLCNSPINQPEDAVSKNPRTKLALQKETIVNLTTVIGGVQVGTRQYGHTELWCETQQTQSCPNHGPAGRSPGQFPRLPSPHQRYETILQAHSQSYCLDKPPLSGYTLPPTAKD